ncbi:MAG: PEP/pyruvate-binding domain-containing protein, partial [Acetobacter sp.]|uniref:PEP/pyruvate-binding domain-containing protein n=1 Tax=Acetobacter sp. TaxID=440 RepID=UPI0039EB530A
MTKWIYNFGAGHSEGNAGMRNLLGGKGANLAEMANIGLPVPPGFTITTEVCTAFYENGRKYPADLEAQLEAAMGLIEKTMGLRFGAAKAPRL